MTYCICASDQSYLFRFIGCLPRYQRFEAFAKTDLAAQIAKCSDIYEIQGAEADIEKFLAGFLRPRRNKPEPQIPPLLFSQVSARIRVTREQLFQAVQAV